MTWPCCCSVAAEADPATHNPSAGFETDGFPGIFVLANGDPQVSGSTLR